MKAIPLSRSAEIQDMADKAVIEAKKIGAVYLGSLKEADRSGLTDAAERKLFAFLFLIGWGHDVPIVDGQGRIIAITQP